MMGEPVLNDAIDTTVERKPFVDILTRKKVHRLLEHKVP